GRSCQARSNWEGWITSSTSRWESFSSSAECLEEARADKGPLLSFRFSLKNNERARYASEKASRRNAAFLFCFCCAWSTRLSSPATAAVENFPVIQVISRKIRRTFWKRFRR